MCPFGFRWAGRGGASRGPLPPFHPTFGIRFLASWPTCWCHPWPVDTGVFSQAPGTPGARLWPPSLPCCVHLLDSVSPQVPRVSCVLCLRSSVGGASCYALLAVRSSLLPKLSVTELNLLMQYFFKNENECEKSMMIPIIKFKDRGRERGRWRFPAGQTRLPQSAVWTHPLPMDVTDPSTGCGSRSARQRSGGCVLGPPHPALAM